MHIVFVESGYPHPHGGGGAGTYVQLVGRELVQRGHRVSVVTGYCDKCDEVSEDEGVVVYRPKFHTPIHYYLSKVPLIGRLSIVMRTLEHGLHQYRFIEKLHKREPIDVVEFTEGGDFWHGWRRSFPIFVHLHGSRFTFLKQSNRETNKPDWWQRKLELNFIQQADHVISPSQALLEIVDSEAGGLRPQTSVMPYPLDPKLLEDVADEPQRPLRVLFAARNDPVKGADALLEAVPLVLKQVPDVEFHFFGFRPKPTQDIPASVIIHPFVSKSELLQWYHRVDVCIVPSQWDNSPNTVYEAMAAGRPTIASHVGGIPELIEDGISGILVPPNDRETLATSLVCLLQKGDLRKRIGRQACERIAIMADLEQNVTLRLSQYQQINQLLSERKVTNPV